MSIAAAVGSSTILIKPRLLLHNDGILVLNPRFEHGAAVIDGITPGVVLRLDKADEYTTNGAAVNRQIRHGDFQLLAGLVY